MPITPFHFGPAALLKAALPQRFSFLTFCYAQVVTDLEVAWNIFAHQTPLHGFAHTYLGAILVGLFCGLSAVSLHRFALIFSGKSFYRTLFLRPLTVTISILSALAGTLSHVFLDSIMHRDMSPLAPFSTHNSLLRLIGLDVLHALCLLAGIIGLVWCGVRARKP